MTTKQFYLLFILSLIVSILGCYKLNEFNNSPKNIKITDCYDENYNKIIGLQCEKEYINSPLYSIAPIISIATAMSILICIFSLVVVIPVDIKELIDKRNRKKINGR